MKVVLNVKNASKIVKPSTDNVIVFDGKEWYVTTKNDLLKECSGLLRECQADLAKQKADLIQFKREIGSQLKQMSDLIETLFTNGGEN